jgi:hypothetical protein
VTAPGDSLVFFEDNEAYEKALGHYTALGFENLRDAVIEVITNAKWGDPLRPLRSGELRRLWTKTLNTGRRQQGLLGLVELRDKTGRTAVFQFLCTSGNDARALYALTLGTFDRQTLDAYREDYNGIPFK